MAIEIVDLPIKMVIFHSYVSLPEGIPIYCTDMIFGLIISLIFTDECHLLVILGTQLERFFPRHPTCSQPL